MRPPFSSWFTAKQLVTAELTAAWLYRGYVAMTSSTCRKCDSLCYCPIIMEWFLSRDRWIQVSSSSEFALWSQLGPNSRIHWNVFSKAGLWLCFLRGRFQRQQRAVRYPAPIESLVLTRYCHLTYCKVLANHPEQLPTSQTTSESLCWLGKVQPHPSAQPQSPGAWDTFSLGNPMQISVLWLQAKALRSQEMPQFRLHE